VINSIINGKLHHLYSTTIVLVSFNTRVYFYF